MTTKTEMPINKALLEVAKDALCELDPDCKYDGSNYKGEPSEKGNSRIQTILELYRVIDLAENAYDRDQETIKTLINAAKLAFELSPMSSSEKFSKALNALSDSIALAEGRETK